MTKKETHFETLSAVCISKIDYYENLNTTVRPASGIRSIWFYSTNYQSDSTIGSAVINLVTWLIYFLIDDGNFHRHGGSPSRFSHHVEFCYQNIKLKT